MGCICGGCQDDFRSSYVPVDQVDAYKMITRHSYWEIFAPRFVSIIQSRSRHQLKLMFKMTYESKLFKKFEGSYSNAKNIRS